MEKLKVYSLIQKYKDQIIIKYRNWIVNLPKIIAEAWLSSSG